MRGLLCLGFCLSLAPHSLAQEETRVLEELFRSEIVYPQEAGEVQLTFAPEFGRSPGQPVMASFGAEYGLSDAWQVGFGWQEGLGGRPAEAEAGEGELELSVKRSFMHLRNSPVSMALGLEAARAAQGDTANDGSSFEFRPFVVLARDFPRWNAQVFALGSVNLRSRAEPGDEPEIDNDGKTEWALGGFLRQGPVVLTQELNWISPNWDQLSPEKQIFWTPGVVWKLPSERVWEVGLGVSVGLSDHADPLSLFVTLTHEFEAIRLFGR